MNNKKPIVVEQEFKSTITEVWDAITQIDQMRQWFFTNIPSFEPVVGFQTKFSVQSESRQFQHQWKLIEVEFKKKIKYNWSYKEYKGEAFVTFELFEKDEFTVLRVTNEGLETFPQDIPEFTRDSCTTGWEYFIKKNLKDYLDRN